MLHLCVELKPGETCPQWGAHEVEVEQAPHEVCPQCGARGRHMCSPLARFYYALRGVQRDLTILRAFARSRGVAPDTLSGTRPWIRMQLGLSQTEGPYEPPHMGPPNERGTSVEPMGGPCRLWTPFFGW